MKKVILIVSVFVIGLLFSCEKNEITVEEKISTDCIDCPTSSFSYIQLQEKIQKEINAGTYDRSKIFTEYVSSIASKGVDRGQAGYRFVLCGNYNCQNYGNPYYVVACATCSVAKMMAGPCPWCGVTGLCSLESECN